MNGRLLLVLAAGLLIRLPLLPLPGTEDTYYFRLWGAQALAHGILNVYTLRDAEVLRVLRLRLAGEPVKQRIVTQTELGPLPGIPDYPPGNILLLEWSCAACRVVQGGQLRAGPLLNACLNFPPLVFSLGIALALWWFAAKAGFGRVSGAVAAVWLNPALILTSPVLGYQEPVFAFFGFVALILLYERRYTWCSLAAALACVIKPQGLIILPVIAAGFLAEGGLRAAVRHGARLALFIFLLLSPYILTERSLALFAGVFLGARFPALSPQELNIWWLVGPLLRAASERSWQAFAGVVGMYSRADFAAIAGFDALWISLPALALFTAVNMFFLWQELRAGNRPAVFWSAALEVYGYTMLSLFVHENHLYAALIYASPLLLLAGRFFVRMFWTLTAMYALNLYLFDGFGRGFEDSVHWARTFAGLDPTIPLAIASVVLFVYLLTRRRWGLPRSTNPQAADRV